LSFILYQNQLLPREKGKVDMEDRGYQFGDGIYEAIRVYSGQMFLLEGHMKRLVRSARELRIKLPCSIENLTDNLKQLIKRNAIGDGMVYFQITRGAAPRKHYFPDGVSPVLTGSATLFPRDKHREEGIKVVLAEDIRWLRCDIKTLNLLGNVLAKQKAHENGAEEAIQHRGDIVTEGASSNVFIVRGGKLITHPADHYILNGITRLFVLDLASKLNIPVVERTFTLEELFAADEAFITSTGNEVKPVTQIDDHPVSDGKAGEITLKLAEAFDRAVNRVKGATLS
jgi:D-alanine transaminase